MSDKPTDPESYLTEKTLGRRTPSEAIDQRLGPVSGKHQYESCLIQTHRLTKKYLDGHPDVPENERLKHIYGLKAEILHYCIPHKLDWRNLMDDGLANLVVKPNHQNDIYYRYLAFNLFLTEPRLVSRFLDYQLVHAVLKPFTGKPSQITKAKQVFLKEVDFMVTHMIDNNMAIHQSTVSDGICAWVRKEMDKFEDHELIEYHDYEFDPNYKFGLQNHVGIQREPYYAGCSDELATEYFNLLSNNSDKNTPFMSQPVIDYMLWNWFGIGDQPEMTDEDFTFINTTQLSFFIREFITRFQIHRLKDRPSVSQKELIHLFEEDFSHLFVNVEASTVYKKLNYYANKGEHPKLHWRNSKKLKSAIGK